MKRVIFFIMGIVWAMGMGHAQSKTDIKPLTIGDTVPDIVFHHLLNYKTPTAKLSDFKGKLVILDFWATWCGSCLAHLPLMDSLQKEFNHDLKVMLVNTVKTGDDTTKVLTFLQKWTQKYPHFSLPTAVGDSLADRLFEHSLIPHYAWIAPNGTVCAITAADKVNRENIQRMLDESITDLPVKKDVDISRPLYLDADVPVKQLLHYSVFLKGKIDGLPNGNRIDKKDGKAYRWAITNTPILKMYELIISYLLPEYNNKRMILEVEDSSMLLPKYSKIDKVTWYRNNLYSYELTVPRVQSDSLCRYMLDDLNRYSNYIGSIENRSVACLILVRMGKEDHVKSKGGSLIRHLYKPGKRNLRNAPMQYLTVWLNSLNSLKLPVIDETHYKGRIDIAFNPDIHFNRFSDLRSELRRYHLDLVKGKRDLPMFVLREK